MEELTPLYKGVPPFMPYRNGFGNLGVILEDPVTKKIQCHLCGKLFHSVARHILHKHDITLEDYRKEVGLALGTPLVSRSTSRKIRNNFVKKPQEEQEEIIKRLQSYNKNLHSGKYSKKSQRGRYSSKQYENTFGTCELQAQAYFWTLYNKEKKIPRTDDDPKLKYLVYKYFDSYEKALLAWGVAKIEIEKTKKEANIRATKTRIEKGILLKYDYTVVKNQVKNFYVINKRLPTWSEADRVGYPTRHAVKKAFGTNNKKEVIKIISK